MKVHLVDGTYELFRHHFAVPSHLDPAGMEVAATRGVVGSVLTMLEEGATHVAVATDHVVESFRNDLYDGYKTSADMEPLLLAQFPVLEDALAALGVTVWAMVEQEADDGMAAGARVAGADERVEQVLICTPDKDLGQSVVGTRIVQFDRRKGEMRDAEGARQVRRPARVHPRLPRARGRHRRRLPRPAGLGGEVGRRGARALPAPGTDPAAGEGLGRRRARRSEARDHARRAPRGRRALPSIATLRTDHPVGTVDEWRWIGPTPEFGAWTERLGAPGMLRRAERLAAERA